MKKNPNHEKNMFVMCVDGAALVRINLLVRSISKIDDYKMVSGICQFNSFSKFINNAELTVQCPIYSENNTKKKTVKDCLTVYKKALIPTGKEYVELCVSVFLSISHMFSIFIAMNVIPFLNLFFCLFT